MPPSRLHPGRSRRIFLIAKIHCGTNGELIGKLVAIIFEKDENQASAQ